MWFVFLSASILQTPSAPAGSNPALFSASHPEGVRTEQPADMLMTGEENEDKAAATLDFIILKNIVIFAPLSADLHTRAVA